MFSLIAYLLDIVTNSNAKDMNYYIAQYLVENLHRMHEVTLNEISSETFISIPTIKGFIRQFEFSNYLIFKKRLTGELESRKRQITSQYESYNPLPFIQGVLNETNGGVIEWNDVEANVKKIVKEIQDAKRVVIMASPTMTSFLTNFQVDMTVFGKTIVVSSLIGENLAPFEEGDLVMMLSSTGRLFQYKNRLTDSLIEQNIKTVVFSGNNQFDAQLNVVCAVDVTTLSSAFETEYLLLSYFSLIRWYYFMEVRPIYVD